MKKWWLNCVVLAGCAFAQWACANPLVIRIIDTETRRGIPLVELSTVNGIRLYTDSAGVIAFDEPGLMNQSVYFFIKSDGYSAPNDGFGYEGKSIQTRSGGSVIIQLKRQNIAERLYRLTGQGIYHHSERANLETPLPKNQLNGGVMGSDSVLTAIYQDKLFWFWGDTHRASYPLGNFHGAAATSALPGTSQVLPPELGVAFQYYTNPDGFVSKMARMPGEGPTWLTSVFTVKDDAGKERMWASYNKIEPPLKVYDRGLCSWHDENDHFHHEHTFPQDASLLPEGHALSVIESGTHYLYFGKPFPTMRVAATEKAIRDASQYQAVNCTVDLSDVISGKKVNPHRGSISYNPWRAKFIAVFTEESGDSYLGEVWYAESRSINGPWNKAIKIASHANASFYNPMQHPYFAEDKGRVIYFEGTYSAEFSAKKERVPRYDYNQLMYRLALDHPKIVNHFVP